MNKVKFKNQPVKLLGELPQSGSDAPDFQLVDSSLSDRCLRDFQSKKKVLLTAPSLDTSVCLAEAKRINDFAKNRLDIVFLFISCDLPFAQQRVCGLEKLENIVTLSMMRDKDFGKHYGLLIDEGPLKGLLARACIVVSEADQVESIQLVEEITNEPNYEALFALL